MELFCIIALSTCLAGIFFAINSIRTVSATPETLSPQAVDGNSALATFCSTHGTGSGTSSSPYLIQDKIINASSVGTCFLLRNTNKYVTFKNCTFSTSGNTGYEDAMAGLYLENCSHVNITGCHIFNNFYGIVLNKSTFITINANNVSANLGSNVDEFQTNDTLIRGNQFMHGGNGITIDTSHNLTIIANHIAYDDNGGISVAASNNLNDSLIQANNVTYSNGGGLSLYGYRNNIIGNNFSRSGSFGISIMAAENGTYNNTIEWNDASHDYSYGLVINTECRGNLIVYNRFSNETINDGGLLFDGHEAIIMDFDYYGPPHVLNKWDNGTVGNFWGDYTTVNPGTSTSNGVTWDTIYNITSQSGYDSKNHRGLLDADNHPLVRWPFTALVAPHLNAPTPNPSTSGTLSFSWTPSNGATSYRLYSYNSIITTLNASVNLVDSFASTAGNDTETDNGTYYYVVSASNGTGTSPLSNCVSGEVLISPQSPESPPQQAWNSTWDSTHGGSANGVTVDANGNSYIAGSNNFGAFLEKFSSSGTLLWNKTWGSSEDGGTGVAVDRNGNVFLAGDTWSLGTGGYDKAFLAKYTAGGTMLWNRTWGGSKMSAAHGIAATKNGEAYIVGSTNSFGAGGFDAFIVKYSASGMQLWNRTWGGSGNDYGEGIAVDRSGEFYICGYTYSFGASNGLAFIAKYSAGGALLWNRTWGNKANSVGANGIAVDAGGNAFITGYTGSPDPAYIAKFSASGNLLWNTTWTNGGFDENGYAVAVDSRGNSYVTGYEDNAGSIKEEVILYKYSPSGTLFWNLTWGYNNSDEEGYGIALDKDGNIFMVGSSFNFGAFIVKYSYSPLPPTINAPTPASSTDGTLSLTWSASIGATSYQLYRYTSIITVLNSSVILVGNFTSTSATDTGLASGMYYYVVVASNSYGSSRISNCVVGVVANVPGPPGIPGIDGTWLAILACFGTVTVILKKRDTFVAKH